MFLNAITAMSPTYWSKRMGKKLYKTDVFRSIASFEEQAVLHDGQKVDRPYRSDIVVEDYTKGTALEAQDLTATSDTLTVSVVKAMLMYIDNVDKIQNKYSAVNLWADEAGSRLSNSIDAYFLYEVLNAGDTIDDGDIGGTAGNGITATTGNILNIFAKINRKLDVNNVPRGERHFVISPQFYDILWQYIAGKATLLGDKTGKNGNIGRYGGLELYLSNNVTGSARWTPANNPTDADTITLDGITCEFVATLSGTTDANPEFHIGSTLADTLTNMTTAINTPGTAITEAATTGYQIPTKASIRTMQNWVAVDGTTYIEIRVRGGSYLTVSGSDGSDVWTATKQIQHLMAGRDKAIDAVIQKNPSVEMASTVSAGKSGVNVLPLTLFGTKVFNQGTNEILDVQIRSDAF